MNHLNLSSNYRICSVKVDPFRRAWQKKQEVVNS